MEKIKSLYPSFLLGTVLLIVSVFAAYLMVDVGVLVGPVIIMVLGGIALIGWMLKDYKICIYFIFCLAVFMSFINRMIGTTVPFGVPLDVVAALSFVLMLIQTRAKGDWSLIKGPITWLYILVVVYQLLQVFNPNAVSIVGWAVSLRGLTSFLLFFTFFQLFSKFEEVKKFTILWLVLATVVAIYGIWQEVFGLNSREHSWIYSNPEAVRLLMIWGHLRKFSFLSDPSAFGLFMAFSALACFILVLGPFSGLTRIVLGICGVLMLVSMGYSGTRTAYAMVAFGIAFYIMLTIRSRRTFVVMLVAVLAGGAILFGPFHGSTINRVRSTFNTEDDASMGVRDKKRIRLQNYVKTHPFGGGINTTGGNGLKYSAGHPLAEGWDADSGYLLIALEMGWIGLIIGLSFFFVVMVKGINNYFEVEDPLLKTTTLAYIVPFMSLSLAHFTQDAMFQKPVYLVIIATYALMLQLPSYEINKIKQSLE